MMMSLRWITSSLKNDTYRGITTVGEYEVAQDHLSGFYSATWSSAMAGDEARVNIDVGIVSAASGMAICEAHYDKVKYHIEKGQEEEPIESDTISISRGRQPFQSRFIKDSTDIVSMVTNNDVLYIATKLEVYRLCDDGKARPIEFEVSE